MPFMRFMVNFIWFWFSRASIYPDNYLTESRKMYVIFALRTISPYTWRGKSP
jgi:hypothetical protein